MDRLGNRSRAPGLAAAALLAPLLFPASGCRSAEERPAPPADRGAELPLDSIAVTINGRGPFRFGLDSGQSIAALIPRWMTAGAEVEQLGPGTAGDGSGRNAVQVDLVRIARLDVGGAVFEDVQAMVYDPAPEHPLAGGTIGYGLFLDRLLTIDLNARTARFEEGSLPAPDGRTVLPLLANPLPAVQIQIGPRRTHAVLDTAWAQGTFTVPLAWKDELPLVGEAELAGRMATLFNEFDVYRARLDGEVGLGGHRFVRPWLTFCDLFQGEVVVGQNVLSSFPVTFDAENGRVRLGDEPGVFEDPDARPPGPPSP